MDKRLSRYKHLIWDWNGTLLDDTWLSLEIINLLLEKRQLKQLTYEQYRAIFDFPVISYYLKLGFKFEDEPFEIIAHEYIEHYERRCFECQLHRESRDILTAVTEAGITQSILSASHQDTLQSFISHFELAGYFEQIIGLTNHYAESKLENGKKWMHGLGCSPQEVLLIGDTVHDYEVARAISCDCLLVACGHQNIEKLSGSGAEVAGTLADLSKILL